MQGPYWSLYYIYWFLSYPYGMLITPLTLLGYPFWLFMTPKVTTIVALLITYDHLNHPNWLFMTPYLSPFEPFRKVLQKTDKTYFIFLGLREHSFGQKSSHVTYTSI